MIRKHMVMLLSLGILIGFLLIPQSGASAAAKGPRFKTYGQALGYAMKNHPATLNLGTVEYTPGQLKAIRDALPENAKMDFTTTWKNCQFSGSSKTVDLRKITHTPTLEDLDAIVTVCPQCTLVNIFCGHSPSNTVMGTLQNRYPKVSFNWKIVIWGTDYYLASMATTFSTFIGDKTDSRLSNSQLEVLKYCKNLRALDLGHNNLYSLDFLKYVPKLEMLIVACNHLIDISPIATLKNLKYLEIFTNKITDLSPLASCTELMDLNIANIRITSLAPLDSLTKLQRLWAIDCKSLSRAEINRFQKAHPACKVASSYKKAGWSWRNHNRYYHYRWCLLHNRWIPFDKPLPDKTYNQKYIHGAY